MEVAFEVNVTDYTARQKVNSYLLTHVGNMTSAGKPRLILGGRPRWEVPVYCAFHEQGRCEELGQLAVCPDTGDILLDQSSFDSPEDIERRAAQLHDSPAAS